MQLQFFVMALFSHTFIFLSYPAGHPGPKCLLLFQLHHFASKKGEDRIDSQRFRTHTKFFAKTIYTQYCAKFCIFFELHLYLGKLLFRTTRVQTCLGSSSTAGTEHFCCKRCGQIRKTYLRGLFQRHYNAEIIWQQTYNLTIVSRRLFALSYVTEELDACLLSTSH